MDEELSELEARKFAAMLRIYLGSCLSCKTATRPSYVTSSFCDPFALLNLYIICMYNESYFII